MNYPRSRADGVSVLKECPVIAKQSFGELNPKGLKKLMLINTFKKIDG
jgi:hypothetical protein